ncbi:MAG: hypothetical protein AB7O24_18225 [Kofleriaceae bacterium]
MRYDDSVRALYQVPVEQFVAERKRLVADLKASGDAGGAKQLAERKRPTVSAWVVNQLYWHARDAFDELLATAEQLRAGDLDATTDHREATAKLRARTISILEDAGHNANESTVRRVMTTLAALAASGGFDPDLPGTLTADRDPPGFAAIGIAEAPKPRAVPTGTAGRRAKADADEAEARERERQAEVRRKQEEEKARLRMERHKLESALSAAKADLDARERAVAQLEKDLAKATKDVKAAQSSVDEIAAELAELKSRG